MRADLAFPVLSPAAPEASAEAPGARGERILALALALVALALHARVLFYPALEVSDADLGSLAAPSWSRLATLLLHAGASALVFGLARRLGAVRATSALAALLFAAHPLRVEAVAWLSQRGVVAGSFFFLLGACLGLRASTWRTAGARIALLLALLAEPRLALGLVWLLHVEHGRAGPRPAWPRIVLDLALILLAGGWLLSGSALERAPDAPAFLTRLAHVPLALFALARQWSWPSGLTPYQPHPALSADPPAAWVLGAGWLALALVLGALRRLQSRWPIPALGGFLFVALASTQALFPRGDGLFSESAGYASLVGLELFLACALHEASVRAARPVRALGWLAVLACASLTVARQPAWRSEQALQAAALAVRDEPRAHDALGLWHLRHGRLGAAQREHERALELARRERSGAGDARALLHLGQLALRRALIPGQERHLERAAENLEECLDAFPDWSAANEVLGEVYQRARRDGLAVEHLEAAAARAARGALQVHLGMLRLRLSDLAGARAAFERAVELEPRSAEAWCGLGIAALAQDEPEEARTALERALALEPEHPEARVALARLIEARGARVEAERNLRRALGVNPDSADGLYSLGMLLSGAARADEALRYLDRLCALPRPVPHVRAHLESARLRMARGEVEVPRARLDAVLAFNPEQAEARALLERLDTGGRER